MDSSDGFEAEEPLAGAAEVPVTRVGATVRRVVPVLDSPARRELQARALMLIGLKLSGAGQDDLQHYCSAALARASQFQVAGEPGTAGDLPGQLGRLCALLTGDGPASGLPREWSDMLDAANRADGPQRHLDVAAALPPLGGVAVRVDSLVSGPRSWQVHLRAEPGWWAYGTDRHRKWETASVHAEDSLGGMYLTQFGGSAGHGDFEELTLRFRPRLNPLAQALTLTFSGRADQVTLEFGLPRPGAARSGCHPARATARLSATASISGATRVVSSALHIVHVTQARCRMPLA